MAQLNFDASQYNPEQGGGQLSVGRHLVVIEKDEIKKAKEGAGGYLEFHLKGVQASEGERGLYRLNLFNAGANAAVTIEAANRQLSAVCHATGIQGIGGDTSVLWNLPFVIEVGYQKGHAPGDPDAKGYTQVNRVYYADGTDIVPGKYGSAGGQQQNQGGFGNQQQQTGQQGQQQFGQQNQNQNQQVDPNAGQQQVNNQPQFGQQNQSGNQQQGNAGGGQQWQPGQGQQQGGQQWTPRTN
jgi:hypothetical protein